MPIVALGIAFFAALFIGFIVSRVVFILLAPIFKAVNTRRTNYYNLPQHLIRHPSHNNR